MPAHRGLWFVCKLPVSSNQVVNRRRKRKASDRFDEVIETADGDTPLGTTTVPTKTTDGGKKPRRKKAAGEKPSLLRRDSSTDLVETIIPWPEHFKFLSQLHRALNLVYTFCCTRKHFATTYDNIKSAVEAHTKKALKIEDVAQVKTLIPRAINFAFVDEDMLLVTIMGEEDGIKGGRAEHFRSLAEDESAPRGPTDGEFEGDSCSSNLWMEISKGRSSIRRLDCPRRRHRN